ncbi:hypothetical protein ACS386_10315 [Flavobacteriaceae bacterium LMO-SS05]
MKTIGKYSKFIPYLYYIAVTGYWFTHVNQSEGITAFPILLFGVPFAWQLIKPNTKLNFTLGITFVCLSSYLILAYIFDWLNVFTISESTKKFLMFGGLFIVSNFVMALWIIRNSIKRTF